MDCNIIKFTMELKLNPIQRVCLLLGLFALGAIIDNDFQPQVFIHLAGTLGFGLILFAIFSKIFGQKKNFWNTVISCLILFLVLHYGNFGNAGGIDYMLAISALIATFVTVFSKFFLEYKGSPIINPAILGLFILIIIGKIFPDNIAPVMSWWGASFKFGVENSLTDGVLQIPVSMILILIWIVFGLKTWRKFPAFFSFLTSFAVLIAIFYQAPEGSTKLDFLKFAFLQDSTIYFMASIMLVEPRTSPVLKFQQIIYGFIAGIFWLLYVLSGTTVLMPLTIIVPNLYFFLMKWLKGRKPNNQI